jgi:HD superfamily phosphohydrolase
VYCNVVCCPRSIKCCTFGTILVEILPVQPKIMDGKNTKTFQKKTLFNDPVYGFIKFPHDFLYTIIDHPYFQRLRRIRQLGLTDYVYPGAVHTRFNHCLGALHLTTMTIETLRSKGVEISEEESEALSLAILLHDIGHGPFSHALERMILPFGHEQISLAIMHLLNEEFAGKLELAVRIFANEYHRPFFHELVAGQLDMDRMDFLHRDSFYTGVVEGKIGYGRLINMLNVREEHLVVEEKGLHTVEQFLMARRLMYWQVYLHKTALAAEKMLQTVLNYLFTMPEIQMQALIPEPLRLFFAEYEASKSLKVIPAETIRRFLTLDDVDVTNLLKCLAKSEPGVPSMLSKGILNRKLFKILEQDHPFDPAEISEVRQMVTENLGLEQSGLLDFLVISGNESSTIYKGGESEIRILSKNGEVKPLGSFPEVHIQPAKTTRYYLIYPKR